MTAIERRTELDRQTGLRWSAGDGVHVAHLDVLTYRLRLIDHDRWHAMVLSPFFYGPRAQFRGSFEDCAGWFARRLEAEVAA